MSDLHVARCLALDGARARFEIVTVHPDAMGRGYPFSINRFFVLHLLFEVVMEAHQKLLPPFEDGNARDLAILALARELITTVEVTSVSNENISEEAFSRAFDAVDQDVDDEGASFLDQDTGLPRAQFDVDVRDPRLLAGLPIGRSWWSTAYASEPEPGEAPHSFVIPVEVPPRFPGDILRAELTAPSRTGSKAWDTPRPGDVVPVTITTTSDERSCECLVVTTEERGAAGKRGGATWTVRDVWVFVEGSKAGLPGDWIGHFVLEVDRRYSLSTLVPATAASAGDDRGRLLRGLSNLAESARKDGDTDSAILCGTRALAFALPTEDDHLGVLFLRASILAERGDHRAALADWTALLADKPDHHGALMGSARSRIRLGEPAATLGELRRAVELGLAGAADLLRANTPAPTTSSQRVSHATYGEGTIVRRLAGDKLEIEFASAGKKILLARFVKPLA